jgi:hypothetical protein
VTKLRHRLALNLTNALASHSVHLADFVKCFHLTIIETETHLDDASFTFEINLATFTPGMKLVASGDLPPSVETSLAELARELSRSA